jgi:hypothetical protein
MAVEADMFLNTDQPPRLPDPPRDYNTGYFSALLNVLRLYFNRVFNVFQNILGPNGGQFIDRPNGLFFNTAPQTFALTNTAYPVLFPTTYLSNAVKVNAGTESRIYVGISGVYNFQYSGQLISTNSSAKTAYLWILRNGTPIGYSTHAYTLTGSDQFHEINWNFNIDMQAGGFIELEIAVTNTAMRLDAVAATAPHPGIPSSVMAVNFVAPLPATLPTPP